MQDALHRAAQANTDLLATRDDRWYPTFHVAAPAGWINDPNGLSHFQGRYQVFFQHHPAGTDWGPMHWGHVSSEDLVTWRREPIALAPSLEEDRDGVFSGSAVTGDDGTLKVFYTGHRWINGVDDAEGNLQVQCLAQSVDGVSFTKLGGVVEPPAGVLDFRDPKVWRAGETWYMIFGVQSAERRGRVWLYRSLDLLSWEFDRVLFEDPDPDVFMIECPDLFPLGEHWVLLYSPMTTARPSGHGGRNGHNAGYLVGSWAPGEDFTPTTSYRPADWGHTFYAPQTFEAPDGRRLLLAWMGAFTLPVASQRADGWSGQLTVPRELSLGEDLRLRSLPVAEIAALRRETHDHGSFDLAADGSTVLLEDAEAFEVELEVDLSRTTSEQVGLQVHRTGEGLCTWVAYDDQSGRVVLDRRSSAGGPGDRGYRSAPHDGGDHLLLRVLVDRGSVEVFVGEGEENLTSLSFPAEGPRSLALTAVAGTIAVQSLRVHRLAPIWESPDR
ncbi:glycoside hydrolase family 32 protein [uncultured Brachybacterium sp.]|uniref:glycoside hydrolase family 32 protein n=1 Tax=uncultured Brachybacterium sp. TaxID=189680 RepID=UPI0026036990|nr:glycoside hydrolase family 32 protein [uncultured Brachybacterium sp.]